ncbi:MAG: hypothetical protein BroJett026_08930 [Betaproteobacteria bacterium]|nr:MAG: hypothetical protein BroJett026_08930 [Betaproteobacteria bacterium]
MQAPRPPAGSEVQDALWVGEWRVDPSLNQIVSGREVVHLEPKGMAVLLHLAARPGAVVSREALLAAVWPGVIVGDNALTQAVAKLRRALGDAAREPAYIQAIAKKGYRLVADVRRGTGLPASTGAGPPSPLARRRARPIALAGLAVAVAAAAIAAAWHVAVITPQEGMPANALDAEFASRAAIPVVVVRPFAALGPAPEQADIARAITADLVTDLSKVATLVVVSGGEQGEPAATSPRPHVRFALTGTVQQDRGRLRLNVHLAEADGGRLLWSERFDRAASDLFSVQDALVRNVLESLRVKLDEAQSRRLAQRHTRNLQAYEHFIRGQAAVLVRRRAANEEARERYWQAIRLDPAFARAYAGVALTYATDIQQDWADDRQATLARAFELATTALRMRPDMPEAHWALAFVHVQDRQHDQALARLDDALRLNPSYADAYALKAGVLTYMGRPREGVDTARVALRLNPGAGSLYFLVLGRAYYGLGDVEQAVVNLTHALMRNAENVEARVLLAATHLRAGDRAAAEWQVQEIRALEPRFDGRAWLAAYAMSDPGQCQRLLDALVDLGL